MPPIGGLGGNTAMRDAHLLTRLLTSAARGERDVVAAVGEYEADMRDYGSAAVRYAVQQQEQALASGAAETAVMRAVFRLLAGVPPLRRAAFGRSWTAPAAARAWELVPAGTGQPVGYP